MIFNSIDFLIFLPLAFILFWIFSSKGKNVQNAVVLCLSIFFYGYWNWKFLWLLLGVTTMSFVSGHFIGEERLSGRAKRCVLCANVVVFLAVLFLFKYYDFFLDSLNGVLGIFGNKGIPHTLRLILPVGISFYIFTSLSYLIDVYKGRIASTDDWLAYFAYVCFFPALFSGPISRSTMQLPQFLQERSFDAERAIKGLKLILWGFFMKLCVADRVGIYVDSVFDNVIQHNGSSIFLANVFYSFQLYCDFGGYSLIAIGTALLFSIELLPNFNRPYLSTSYGDYWKREHMSLTNWLMDYVYYPMIGDSSALWWWNTCMIITFLISGLWHGAAWTFVLWGLYQGVFLIIDTNTSRKRKKFEKQHNLRNRWWWILTMTAVNYFVVLMGLFFFRANSVTDALFCYKQLFSNFGNLFTNGATMLYGSICIAILMAKDYVDEYWPEKAFWNGNNRVITVISCAFLLCLILYCGVFDGGQFIYFQF